MPGSSPSLLPPPKADDPEDVSWALSTADALWKRGEYQDAINWIRRAATAASEAEDDVRVIELAKAAADLANMVAAFGSKAPPPPDSVAEIEFTDDEPTVERPLPVAKAPPPGKPPAKPPPRARREDALPLPARLPTPNPVPSPYREIPIGDFAAPVPEETFPSGVRPIDPFSTSGPPDDSDVRIPTVPPLPPDFAPTPMAMRAVPRIAPDEPIAFDPESMEPAVESYRPPPIEQINLASQAAETPSLANAAVGIATPMPPPSARVMTLPMPSSPPEVLLPRPAPPEAPKAPPPEVRKAAPPVSAPQHVSEPPPRPRPLTARPPAAHVERMSLDLEARHAALVPPRAPRLATIPSYPAPPPTSATTEPLPEVARPAAPALGKSASGRTMVLDPDRFEALGDVPDDAREALVREADVVALLPDEEAPAPALAIVLHGELEVRGRGVETRLDSIPAFHVRLLAPMPPAKAELLVIGGGKGARYLALDGAAVETLRAAAPWVVQELEEGSDDVHVVAGATRGKLGTRLDGALLGAILRRAETMRLAPHAKVVKAGEPVRALVVLGAGTLSLRAGETIEAPEIATLDPGDILFGPELLSRLPAPSTVRAGPEGALVIVATRAATEEILVTVPPIVELLSDD
jgi:hypothetical protein